MQSQHQKLFCNRVAVMISQATNKNPNIYIIYIYKINTKQSFPDYELYNVICVKSLAERTCMTLDLLMHIDMWGHNHCCKLESVGIDVNRVLFFVLFFFFKLSLIAAKRNGRSLYAAKHSLLLFNLDIVAFSIYNKKKQLLLPL